MATPSASVTAALASLQERWGAAAPRRGIEVIGSLAAAPAIDRVPDPPFPSAMPPVPARRPDSGADGRVVPTGFAALDAILGVGGLPRDASVALRGDGSSGKTTLALRLAAEAQASGCIVAWLDLPGSFDPVEAVARGVRPEWLVVLTPISLDEGLAMAGALVQGRAVDLLLVDLPPGRRAPAPSDPPRQRGGPRPPTVADRLHRLAAIARRAGTLLVVLEPPSLASGLDRAVEAAAGVRLELIRRAWIRLGRDVVGQRTEVVVARNRSGPPGRRAELRILYADGGPRDACLRRGDLLAASPSDALRTGGPATPATPPGGDAARVAEVPGASPR